MAEDLKPTVWQQVTGFCLLRIGDFIRDEERPKDVSVVKKVTPDRVVATQGRIYPPNYPLERFVPPGTRA